MSVIHPFPFLRSRFYCLKVNMLTQKSGQDLRSRKKSAYFWRGFVQVVEIRSEWPPFKPHLAISPVLGIQERFRMPRKESPPFEFPFQAGRAHRVFLEVTQTVTQRLPTLDRKRGKAYFSKVGQLWPIFEFSASDLTWTVSQVM